MKVWGRGWQHATSEKPRSEIKDCQGSLRSDDSVTVPSLASRIRSTDSKKSRAIRGQLERQEGFVFGKRSCAKEGERGGRLARCVG